MLIQELSILIEQEHAIPHQSRTAPFAKLKTEHYIYD